MKKAAVFVLFIAFGLLLSETTNANQHLPGEGVTVQPARATWNTGYFQEVLVRKGLEELGYSVKKPKELQNPLFYQTLALGDVDYWANGWFPMHNEQMPENFYQRGELVGYIAKSGGLQGYLVSKEEVEKFGITSLDDFKRPEVKNAFDHNGDGKAELYGCPPGWGCNEGINAMLDKFDIDYINHVDAGYSANFAEALSHVKNGEPALYYTWGPSAWLLALAPGDDVMWINAPGIVRKDAERASGVDGAVSDPINMGFVAADIEVAANNGFLENNPAAAELFRQVRLPLGWISEVDKAMGDRNLKDAQVRPLAEKWIRDNRGMVDEWLNAARNAAQ